MVMPVGGTGGLQWRADLDCKKKLSGVENSMPRFNASLMSVSEKSLGKVPSLLRPAASPTYRHRERSMGPTFMLCMYTYLDIDIGCG